MLAAEAVIFFSLNNNNNYSVGTGALKTLHNAYVLIVSCTLIRVRVMFMWNERKNCILNHLEIQALYNNNFGNDEA